jgi:membrane protease YdiL (CAAX protease family)
VSDTEHLLRARELAAIAWTFSANAVVHRLLPDKLHVVANLAAAGGVLGIAAASGASATELGLAREDLRAGARAGAATAAVTIGAVTAATLLPATRDFFADARISEVGHARALYELVVRIPVGTALAEELLFRSGMNALFAEGRSWGAAMTTSSLLFGLWHVLPTLESLTTHATASRVVAGPSQSAGAVAGVVGLTAAAGIGLSMLARRSRSVLASIIVHAALNASTYAAGRVVALRRAARDA